MTPLHVLNWQALYLATAIGAVMAATLAAIVLASQLWTEHPWRRPFSWRAAMLFLPHLWWRWQKLYLLATPAILAITAGFGLALKWS